MFYYEMVHLCIEKDFVVDRRSGLKRISFVIVGKWRGAALAWQARLPLNFLPKPASKSFSPSKNGPYNTASPVVRTIFALCAPLTHNHYANPLQTLSALHNYTVKDQ